MQGLQGNQVPTLAVLAFLTPALLAVVMDVLACFLEIAGAFLPLVSAACNHRKGETLELTVHLCLLKSLSRCRIQKLMSCLDAGLCWSKSVIAQTFAVSECSALPVSC